MSDTGAHATTKIIRSLPDMHAEVRSWKNKGARVGLVPTMGALHEGHLSLVTLAQQACDRTIVSIFVNPTQFGPNEDFQSYPRPEADDIAKLDKIGVDAVFIPTTDDMYPDGYQTSITVNGITDILCGAARPGHFDGVATIVTKLFHICEPNVAVFGEKDYQQLLIIRRFVSDLNLPVDIRSGPTTRDADGLAISSRNRYLSPAERQTAAQLNRVLDTVGHTIKQGADITDALQQGTQSLLDAGFDAVDYVDVRASDTLEPLTTFSRPARILAAAHVGKTRLIDNREITP